MINNAEKPQLTIPRVRQRALKWWNSEINAYQRWWYVRFKHVNMVTATVEDIIKLYKSEVERHVA